MMWLPGALIGGLLAYQIYSDAWAIGAAVGALVGLIVGRLLAEPPARRPPSELETRLTELTARLDRIDRRLADLERVDRRAPSVAAWPASATPETAPTEPPGARAETIETVAPTAKPAVAAAAPAVAAAAAVAQSPPDEPLLAKVLQEWPIWRWLTGGNTVVRVGVVVLFFGVAFLLKYASERFDLPTELRLAGVAAGALVLLALGWRLRERRPGYAVSLQGAGIGILYLVIFTAFRLYHLLSPAQAFALLVAVAALSAVIAVAQDALALAVLGSSGGFLAPILASTGGGSHVMLFSYYAVLNAAILVIAWFKAWRVLNLVGFAFTYAIGTVWGVKLYRPEHFASTEPFLALFFAFYVAIPILFARRRAAGLERYVDTTLVFGVPLVTFGLQASLVHDFEYATAWSALVLSAVYLVLAKAVFGQRGEALRLLAEAFLALGVVFGSLAIPLALEGRWTSAAWALEGAAAVWVGLRQQRWLPRAFGLLLQIAGGCAFLMSVDRHGGDVPVFNSFYLGCLLISLAGFFSNWWMER